MDWLIKPTLLAVQLLHAQRDGDFLLQQVSLEAYFFAAPHMNHARYMTWYLRNVENIATAAKNGLLKGEHVCRHSDGGTPVPADQFGRTNIHQAREGADGLRGISTNAEQVAVWVGSFSVCAHLDLAIEAMYCHDDAGEKDVQEGRVDTPSVSHAPVAYGLLYVVSCSCSAERKACSEKRCSSHSAGLSCTEYCYCEGEMRDAVHPISTHMTINWLTRCRKKNCNTNFRNDSAALDNPYKVVLDDSLVHLD